MRGQMSPDYISIPFTNSTCNKYYNNSSFRFPIRHVSKKGFPYNTIQCLITQRNCKHYIKGRLYSYVKRIASLEVPSKVKGCDLKL